MKIALWLEEDNDKKLWYCFALCNLDGIAIGSIYRSDDYGFSLGHAERLGNEVGLRVEDTIAKSIKN